MAGQEAEGGEASTGTAPRGALEPALGPKQGPFKGSISGVLEGPQEARNGPTQHL